MNIVFAYPYLLGFLAVLPVLWWLLRLTPPSPQKIIFPAIALLRDLVTPQQTPTHTPWWILLLRMIIAALIITAFAEPLIDPQPITMAHGTTLIAVDNDWAAARNWDMRQKTLHALIHKAEHDNRAVILLALTPNAAGDTLQIIGPEAAKAAYSEIDRIKPQPWPSDWVQAKNLVQKLGEGSVTESYWLSSDIGNSDAQAFYQALQLNSPVHVLDDSATPVYVLQPPQSEGDDTVLSVMRAETDKEAVLSVAAKARDGQTLAHLPLTFTAGAPRATTPLTMPLDIRNQIARFEIEGQHTAAATALLDASWEHRPVGLIGDKSELDQHSLLSGLFYIDRALKPFADIHVGSLDELLKQNMAALILPDTELNDDQITQLSDWVKHGGVLIRFAGERLSVSQNPKESSLLPVVLRSGDRTMGGALSWATPQTLQSFPATSPFHGLDVPGDVKINRQVLAEPSADLTTRSWANLSDGTPLVTAKTMGQGLSVLFHVPAKSDWSNLPLSGLFVDMLRRIVDLSHGVNAADTASSFTTLPPLHLLNAFGEEQKPGDAVKAVTDDDFSHLIASPSHPPGLYGREAINRAFNLGSFIGQPEALKNIPTESYIQDVSETNLQPYLLVAAFILLLVDFLISLRLRGLLNMPRKAVAGIILAAFSISTAQAASTDDKNAVELTSKTYLAYVQTGDRQTDSLSASGLAGLARILQRRTSMDQIAVTSVDPNRDELAFFPFLYWPIVPGEQPLSSEGVQHVNDYLHHGGMILFDTMTGDTPSPALLQRITANIDIPPLVKLPADHVLKHSFYLLDDFQGRYANTDFWLEPENLSSYDGVATVLFGSNGWAGAWAMDETGRPLLPCTPGGEAQREHAFRFGVNLMMYALTGNYKSDQLHAQELLKRMGK
jgi:hypothetical protein